jgi:hypothetical protein
MGSWTRPRSGRSLGRKLWADKVQEKLFALGDEGSERSTRCAVQIEAEYGPGRVRVHRPWVTAPGMWLRYDFDDGPGHRRVRTTLFCA